MLLFAVFGLFKERPQADIPVDHYWLVKPAIRVCPDSIASFDRVVEAMEWTAKRGARWDGIAYDMCLEPPGFGEVYITTLPEGMENSTIAGLSMTKHLNGFAHSTMIGLDERYVPEKWVLEHELLHAQGLDHHTMTDHVMFRYVPDGGWDDNGIKRSLDLAWELYESISKLPTSLVD